ncbi:hypothetical protein NUM3379_31860 [Kineococcus sp. NUM-3379]
MCRPRAAARTGIPPPAGSTRTRGKPRAAPGRRGLAFPAQRRCHRRDEEEVGTVTVVQHVLSPLPRTRRR